MKKGQILWCSIHLKKKEKVSCYFLSLVLLLLYFLRKVNLGYKGVKLLFSVERILIGISLGFSL